MNQLTEQRMTEIADDRVARVLDMIADDEVTRGYPNQSDRWRSFAARLREPKPKPKPEPGPITLCTNADLADEYHNLDDLPDDVYDKGNGMARYCAEASRKILPLASQMFPGRVISPDQLKDAAVHWALMLAFDSCRERSSEVMYSELRDYHDRKRTEAIASWQLTIK